MEAIIRDLIRNGGLVSLETGHVSLPEKPSQANTKEPPEKGSRERISTKGNLEIIETYEDKNAKITVRDFITLYNNRYILLQGILRQRQELQNATTIRKAKAAQDNDAVSFIGIVLEKGLTKNKNIILTLEDQTDTIKCIFNKTKIDSYNMAKDMAEDEVVGVVGVKKDNIVFGNTVINPDVPITKELKKSPVDEAAVFISDLHIGSKSFLKEALAKFFSWLNMNTGTDAQRDLVKKVKYLFVLGDLVDGVGVYPEQDKDLKIKDIYEQCAEFEFHILSLNEDIKVIICPGNHDPVRIAEPQPPIPAEFFPEISKKQNVFFVSSPSIVRISKQPNFSGLDFLIYHGFSFPFFADAIESIRLNGGLENTDNIMVYLLKRRHLAPTHGSTQYQLGYNTDPLVIKTVPDFFVTGHIHRSSVKNYRNITLLNCSCWISQTAYQEKRGIVPQPGRAIYINLKTRESKILNFLEN